MHRISQVIGRGGYGRTRAQKAMATGYHYNHPDEAFWDKLRHGLQAGFDLSGLFAQPIARILADHVLSDGFTWSLEGEALEGGREEYTNGLLRRLGNRYAKMFRDLLIDKYALGNQYVIINADGSLSIPSPDMVDVEYDTMDYRRMTRLTITSRHGNTTVTDTYTDQMRVIERRTYSGRGMTASVTRKREEYENLLGVIPAVHFTNGRSANEIYGRPVIAAMYPLLSRYDDVSNSMLDGVELHGNPEQVYEGVEDPEQERRAHETATGDFYEDAAGNLVERRVTEFNRNMVEWTSGTKRYLQPSIGWTEDSRNALKTLFHILLEHTGIPETMWGTEMGQARASTKEQMQTFNAMIRGYRLQLTGVGADNQLGLPARDGLAQLAHIWLQMRALTDQRVVVDEISVSYPQLEDYSQEWRYKMTSHAHGNGWMRDATALRLFDLVDDPEEEVRLARKEMEARRTHDFDAAIEADAAAERPTQMRLAI